MWNVSSSSFFLQWRFRHLPRNRTHLFSTEKNSYFVTLCGIQNLPQNLNKWNQKLAFSIAICAGIDSNWIVCRLCAGSEQHSKRLYLRAAIFVPTLWIDLDGSVFVEISYLLVLALWEYMSRFSEDSDLTYSISFSQIGSGDRLSCCSLLW